MIVMSTPPIVRATPAGEARSVWSLRIVMESSDPAKIAPMTTNRRLFMKYPMAVRVRKIVPAMMVDRT